ncbi:uncharacterized protein JCM15063_000885 [Sporobolomyces koalae]|uniref:uncharacterized protein n=1 Tax=Sporobolomyces koalae TaxID=500713 RepID=UPI00317BDFF3
MSQDSATPAKRTYHGEDEAEIAYRLQVIGAREGAIKGTAIGATLMALAQWRFPLVQRQTLAGKAFLVMWATIFGMVTHADHYLLQYEAEHRVAAEKWRTQARNELAGQGIVPSETAMRKWKEDYDNSLRATLESPTATPVSTPSTNANNVAIEQSKILQELGLDKKL